MTIGIFDSGYGGLTILKQIRALLPEYDFIYLGDNARTPYGNRSFDIVYKFTRQCTKQLFDMGCDLVILACNTASAKALKSIQQNDLPLIDPNRRVLGIIRPTAEYITETTKTKHVGIFATAGTIQSKSYAIELMKLDPEIVVSGVACPMWVPLVENNESMSDGADYFVQKYCDELMRMDSDIDTIILGCTHYPMLIDKINKYIPQHVKIVPQGPLVADSLKSYLKRHPEIDARLSKNGTCQFFTSESPEKFSQYASIFLNKHIDAEHITIKGL